MRVYHFVNLEFGLDDLRRRRLKIATLNELNDPFELFGINLTDPALRHAFTVSSRTKSDPGSIYTATRSGPAPFARDKNTAIGLVIREGRRGFCWTAPPL